MGDATLAPPALACPRAQNTYLNTPVDVAEAKNIGTCIIVGLVILGLFLFLGIICRPCLTGDAAMMDVPVIDADDADADVALADSTKGIRSAYRLRSDAVIAAGP